MFDIKIINEAVHRSSGTMNATKLRTTKIQIKEVDRTTKNVILQPIKFCDNDVKGNLLSITALLSQGFITAKDSKIIS